MENGFVEVENGRIFYQVHGEGSQDIVWVHGMPLNSDSWYAQFNYFKSDFRSIALDLRGYGQSSELPHDTKSVMLHELNSTIRFLSAIQGSHISKKNELKKYLTGVRPDVMYFVKDCNSAVKTHMAKFANIMAKRIAKYSTVFMIYQGDITAPSNSLYTKSLFKGLEKHGIHHYLISTSNNSESI